MERSLYEDPRLPYMEVKKREQINFNGWMEAQGFHRGFIFNFSNSTSTSYKDLIDEKYETIITADTQKF